MKRQRTYEPIFEIADGPSNELHFAKRDDGLFIISKRQVLRGGEKSYLRSSVTMDKELALKLANKILENLG